jgi:hypothetical protein
MEPSARRNISTLHKETKTGTVDREPHNGTVMFEPGGKLFDKGSSTAARLPANQESFTLVAKTSGVTDVCLIDTATVSIATHL